MQIWPAIDLLDGKCVRLEQGDFDRETVFSSDPVAMAQHWVAAGAKHLHLVDLDAARDGSVTNRESIREILDAVDIECEVGGGIRDDATVTELLDLGVSRLVVGTQAIRQPEWFASVCRRCPDRMVLGIDARDGQVATNGWLQTSRITAVDLARQFAEEPLAGLIYTDIAKDGMMSGPNFEELRTIAESVRHPVIASGGIRSVEDLTTLGEIPVAGAIVGRALYENKIDLSLALSAAGES